MHQVAWHSSYTNTAFTRSLSCFACDFGSVCSHYCIKKGKVTFKDTGDQEQARDLEQSDNAQPPQEDDLVTDGDMPSSLFALVQSLEPGGNAQTPQENDLVTGDLVTHNLIHSTVGGVA